MIKPGDTIKTWLGGTFMLLYATSEVLYFINSECEVVSCTTKAGEDCLSKRGWKIVHGG
jgi:hypothetical protein